MTTEPEVTTRAPVARHRAALAPTVLLVVAVLLIAANLRPAVTGLGPVLDQIRLSLHVSPGFLSVLTALPAVCFGLAGFLAPVLARQVGLGRALGVAVALITAGLGVRVLDGPVVLLAGSLVACAGIAVCNVLIPVVIRESFPHRIGLLTGLYTGVLQGVAALGSILTPVLDVDLGGWRPALSSWGALAALALFCWLLAARPGARADVSAEGLPTPSPTSVRHLARSRLAWAVTAYFGLQAMFAYAVMGWVPQVLMAAGVGRGTAGVMAGIMSLLGVPLSLLVVPVASRARSQSAWLAGITSIGVCGVLGLLIAPGAAPWLWSVLAGIGMGVFALAIALISLRTANADDTRALSTMTQGVGYLVASLGPLVVGVLHGMTGGWTASMAFLLVGLLIQMVVGLFAGRDRFV